ncbi:MAG: hypothetical protein AAFW83_09780 [Pseudomonadota bacterium]
MIRTFFGAALVLALTACGAGDPEIPLTGAGSPYLFAFAGDDDNAESDFLLVLDVDPASDRAGTVVSTLTIGQKNTMPHHTEYVPPPPGEPIFMNGHRPELSLIVDVTNLPDLAIQKTFSPPAPLRFPHDYTRTPSGTRLVGFLRSEGTGPDAGEKVTPGNHGGIAEYSVDGALLRAVSAAAPSLAKPMRPYAFALLQEYDRLVVTSAPMMEKSWADVVQIYRYSDLSLLHTLDLPPGQLADGTPVPGAEAAGFGPRRLADGSVFLNSYGCAFYHLTAIDSDAPTLTMVHTLKTPPARRDDEIRGACGIPVRVGRYWVQPAGFLNAVVVLDLADPDAPREVFRLKTPDDFRPHWLAKDPASNRLVLGAELGGEQGFFILRIDETTGRLGFDPAFRDKKPGRVFDRPTSGYVSLNRDDWPHGKSGPAWGHAALFLE